MMRRISLLVVILLVSIVLLSGCFAAPQARQAVVVNVAAVTYPGGAPASVLSLYKAALEVNKAAAGEYELKLTTVTPAPTDYQKEQSGPSSVPPTVAALEQAMGQDPPPDVAFFSSSYEFGAALEKGLLQDLDSYLRAERNFKRDDYFAGTLEAMSEGGRLYALPISVAPTVLQYDKRLFEAAGLPPPDGSLDWNGFVSIARALTKTAGDPQTDQYGLSLFSSFALPMFIWQNGGDIVSKDGRRSLLAEPEAVEAIKFYAQMLNDPSICVPYPKKSGSGALQPMAKVAVRVGPGEAPPIMVPGGRAAMQFMSGMGLVMGYGPWGPPGSERALRIAEVPHGKNKATMLEIQSVIGLTSKARNGQVAFRALAALAAEMQKELPVPASRSAAKNLHQMNPNLDEKDAQVMVSSLEYARAIPFSLQNKIMMPLNRDLMQPLMEGTKTPAEAAAAAAEAIDAALNE